MINCQHLLPCWPCLTWKVSEGRCLNIDHDRHGLWSWQNMDIVLSDELLEQRQLLGIRYSRATPPKMLLLSQIWKSHLSFENSALDFDTLIYTKLVIGPCHSVSMITWGSSRWHPHILSFTLTTVSDHDPTSSPRSMVGWSTGYGAIGCHCFRSKVHGFSSLRLVDQWGRFRATVVLEIGLDSLNHCSMDNHWNHHFNHSLWQTIKNHDRRSMVLNGD